MIRNILLKMRILLLINCLNVGFLFAQDIDSIKNQEFSPTQNINEVVISANRFENLKFNTPEAIEVNRSKTFEKYQLRSSPEALQATTGVFVQKTNHGGGSPFMRGLTGNQTLLLIDGIRLSNSTMRYGPNQYLNTIDVFSVDKMEVLRGNGSVQYGSDALGGTIQVFSHNMDFAEKADWGSKVIARIATQGMEQTIHSRINFSNKRVAFSAGASFRKFGDLVGGDTTGTQSPSGYREFDFDLKAKIKLAPKSILTLAYQDVHQFEVPVYHKVELENYAVNQMDPQKRQLAYIRLNQVINNKIFQSAIFTASINHAEEGRESQKNGSTIFRYENDKVRTYTFLAEFLSSNNKNWSASSGVEIYNDLVNSIRTDTDLSIGSAVSKRCLYPDGSTMASFAAFSLHTFDFEKWNISSGARFNMFIITVDDNTLGTSKLKPSAIVGNLAILRKLNIKTNVFISANSGYRAPNIDDLGTLGIVDFRYETPNYGLKPEKSFQYQMGFKFLDKKIKAELFLYRNELYNLIVRNRQGADSIEGYPIYQKDNVERAYIQGIESSVDYQLNQFFKLQGNITYTFGQNITKNEPARRIPPIFGRLELNYQIKNLWLNLEWQSAAKQSRLAQGDVDDNRIPDGGTPGWNVFNFNTGYTFKFISVDLSIKNLMNVDYRYHGSGINGCGRSAFLTLTVNL